MYAKNMNYEATEPAPTKPRPSASRYLPAVIALGDAAILIAFAAIGRASHGEQAGGRVAGTLATSAPFLFGWFAAALAFRFFSVSKFTGRAQVLRRTAGLWVLGAAIALLIRSLAERRIVPLSFVVVVLLFNGVLLSAWHLLVVTWNARK